MARQLRLPPLRSFASQALHPQPTSSCSRTKLPPGSFVYCNLPGLELAQTRPSRIYLMALGGSGDVHTPNTAEGALYIDGQRRQGLRLLPGTMMATDIT